MRAVALHDRIVARRIEKLAGQIDIIHTWPLGALETLKTAAGWEFRPFWKDPMHTRGSPWKWCRRNATAWG